MTRKAFLGNSLMLAGAAAFMGRTLQAAEVQAPVDYLFGKVSDSARYESLNPHFKKAFEFLRRKDLAQLPKGVYPIDGDACKAIIQEPTLVPSSERKVECHRNYIDIQAPLTGPELIGVCTLTDEQMKLPYDAKGDCILFDAKRDDLLLNILQPGWFGIFFPPKGGHAPSCLPPDGPAKIRKVVIKVRA